MSFPDRVATLFRHFKFDHHFYRDHHVDLNGLSPPQLYKHFLLYGWREKRICNHAQALRILVARHGPLPNDFSWSGYRAANPDLATSLEQESQLKLHYLQLASGRPRLSRHRREFSSLARTANANRSSIQMSWSKRTASFPLGARSTNTILRLLRRSASRRPSAREESRSSSIASILTSCRSCWKSCNCCLAMRICFSRPTLTRKRRKSKTSAQIGAAASRCEIFPNRGRDVAPKFFGFADVYQRYEIFLHLHTKKSPHGGNVLANWRDYLVNR